MPKSRLAEPATEKQNAFAAALYRNAKNLIPLDADQLDTLRRMKNHQPATKQEASWLITGLLRCERKPQEEKAMAKPGYYVCEGEYLVVVENRMKTRTYAKRLVVTKRPGQRSKARWEYAPGKGHEVAHMEPLTIEEAAKFGHMHGVCLICAKALTDPKSVKRGIGPYCARKLGVR